MTAALLLLAFTLGMQTKETGSPELRRRADSLAALDPEAEARAALRRGDRRVIVTCGIVCRPPGVDAADSVMAHTKSWRIIAGTTDAIANADVMRLNDVASAYATRYNRVIRPPSPRGTSRTGGERPRTEPPSPPRPTARAAPSDSLKIVLLGTGVGPIVNLVQYGASTLVEAGGQRFLFDCGRGATLRLAQAGVPEGSITRVFLTHLHSDHVIQLPDLLLTGWAAGRRDTPLEVWGPKGTRAMMDHMQEAFAFDIHTRRDVDEHFSPAGIMVMSHEVTTDSVVFAEGGVTVTAFLVDHGVVQPAFGYRVDFGGRSVVLSGDTRVSENLVRHAQGGIDVLIHETIDAEAIRTRPDRPSPAAIDAIVAHHTTPEQAGEIFRRVAPRLAVYSHAPNSARVLALTRTTYTGPLQVAEDLLTIRVGPDIRVEHHVQRAGNAPAGTPD